MKNTLKAREEELITELNNIFDTQLMNISHEEERWVERESAISDLLENIEDKCRETGKIREPHMILKNAHDVYSKLKL